MALQALVEAEAVVLAVALRIRTPVTTRCIWFILAVVAAALVFLALGQMALPESIVLVEEAAEEAVLEDLLPAAKTVADLAEEVAAGSMLKT